MTCDCTPGSIDTWWFETRGPKCLADELREWDPLTDLIRDIIVDLNEFSTENPEDRITTLGRLTRG